MGDYRIDPHLKDLEDKRRGMTLVIRFNQPVCERIAIFLKQLATIEPQHYYYPEESFHLTLLSIISCSPEFDLGKINVDEYIPLIQKSLAVEEKPSFTFQGVTASPSSVMIQGFSNNDWLNKVRENLRINFKKSSLEQTIDKRYVIQSAHATVMRFANELSKKNEFIQALGKFRTYDFGSFEPRSVELVCNDWYHKKEHVQVLHQFLI